MGFIMDGLDAEEYDREYSDRQLVSRILTYLRPHAPRLALVSGAIVLSTLVSTILPIQISSGIDLVQDNPEQSALQQLIVIIIILGVLTWLFNAIRQWFAASAIAKVTLELREDAFESVVKRDLSFYDKFPSGKIVSRVTSDTQLFSEVFRLVTELLGQGLLVAILLVYLFSINAQLALILVIMAPFIFFTALAFRRIARRTVTQSRRANAEISSHVQETVSGIRIAKTFRKEEMMYDEFVDVNNRAYRVMLPTGYTFAAIFPILNAVAGIATAALVYFGILSAQNGAITSGEWFLFIQGLTLFWFPLTSIASFWSQFQLGLAAGERVFALIDAEAVVVQQDSVRVDRLDGRIQFKNVDFAYKEDEPVLTNFSLEIHPRETIALVGHTGSGKSSIGKLVARFYEYQSGQLLIDEYDIRSLDLESYHGQLGIVSQTPFLFTGTVRDNIRYSQPDASDEQVEEIAYQVAQGDWLQTLPNGLDTEVSERGSNLSLGQRQLISIARVLLQNPSIFILDEATASVDPLTETLIQEGLEVVLSKHTSIVIAHRLSTIKSADRIIVLREGDIIEEGSHDQLLETGGHYAELYNTYFRHQSLEYIERAHTKNSA